MRPFTNKEKKWVFGIFFTVVLITLANFRTSYMRSRDAQRKADIGSVINALGKYKEDFGFYPLSVDGKLAACAKPDSEISDAILLRSQIEPEELADVFRACEWGEDPFRDIADEDYPAYLEKLPIDPKSNEGYSYLYFSNTKRFQIFAALEEGSEKNNGIVTRRLDCGEICNFGRSSGATPLSISIEEYEQELLDSSN